MRFIFAVWQVIWIICHDFNVEKQKKKLQRRRKKNFEYSKVFVLREWTLAMFHVNSKYSGARWDRWKEFSSGNIWLKQNYEWWMDDRCVKCVRSRSSLQQSEWSKWCAIVCYVRRLDGANISHTQQNKAEEKRRQRNTRLEPIEWITAIEKCIGMIKVVAKLFQEVRRRMPHLNFLSTLRWFSSLSLCFTYIELARTAPGWERIWWACSCWNMRRERRYNSFTFSFFLQPIDISKWRACSRPNPLSDMIND